MDQDLLKQLIAQSMQKIHDNLLALNRAVARGAFDGVGNFTTSITANARTIDALATRLLDEQSRKRNNDSATPTPPSLPPERN